MSDRCSNYNPVVGLMCTIEDADHWAQNQTHHENLQGGHKWDDQGGVRLCGATRADGLRCHLRPHEFGTEHVGRGIRGNTYMWYVSFCPSKSAEEIMCGGEYGHDEIHMGASPFHGQITEYVWEYDGAPAMLKFVYDKREQEGV